MSGRSSGLAARLWWALLPYAGCHGYRRGDGGVWHWWMRFSVVPYLLWRLVSRLPGSAPFEGAPPIWWSLPADSCGCDYCRGVAGARLEP